MSYFATYDFSDEFIVDGQTMSMRFWHRPLRAMTGSLREAGFTLDVLDEPAPLPEAREADPRAWDLITTGPRFIFLSATARAA